jgi:hypothetical protein
MSKIAGSGSMDPQHCKKGKTTNIYFFSSFFVVVESEIRDGKKSGSGINIPDPQR